MIATVLTGCCLGAFAQDGSYTILPNRSFSFNGAQLEMVALPTGENVVTVIDWHYPTSSQPPSTPVQRRALHSINIAEEAPVWLGRFEVTQAQFEAVMGYVPSHLPGDPTGGLGSKEEFPVYFVSAEEAVEFCRKLTQMGQDEGWLDADLVFRLPYREEWQLAAQEGISSSTRDTKIRAFERGLTPVKIDNPKDLNQEAFAFSDIRHFTGYEFGRPFKIGFKYPNRMGFSDVFGNVEELVRHAESDAFYRCGGSFQTYLDDFEYDGVFHRVSEKYKSKTTGFRVALSSEKSHQISAIPGYIYNHLLDNQYRAKDFKFLDPAIKSGVHDFVITSDEQIWISTDEALIHLTGGSKQIYNENNISDIPDFAVSDLLVDAQDRVWMFFYRAGKIIVYCDGEFHSKDIQLHDNWKEMKLGWDGRVWIQSNGSSIVRFSGCPCSDCGNAQEVFKIIGINGEVSDFWPLNESELILSIGGKNFTKYNIENKENTIIWDASPTSNQSIIPVSNEDYWLCSQYQIGKWLPKTNTLKFSDNLHLIGILDNWEVTSLSDGSLSISNPAHATYSFEIGWNYFNDPVLMYFSSLGCNDPKEGRWICARDIVNGLWRITEGPIESLDWRSGITEGAGWSTAPDKDGGLWMVTNRGLSHWQSNGTILNYYGGDLWGSLGKGISSVYEDSQGRVWLSMYNQNWNKSQPFELKTTVSPTPRTSICLLDNQQFKYLPLPYSTSQTQKAYSIHEDENQVMWFGMRKGLVRYKTMKDHSFYTHEDGLPEVKIKMITHDKAGRLWLGTDGGGLILMDRETETFQQFTEEDGLSSNAVWAYLEDRDGVQWFGTNNGITRFQDEKFAALPESAGLIDSAVNNIFEDGNGYLWVGCNRGIYRLKKQQVHDYCDGKISSVDCEAFGVNDGMQVAETNGEFWPSGYQFPDGRMIFPAPEGFEVVDPSDFPETDSRPVTLFHEVSTFTDIVDSNEVQLPIKDSSVLVKPEFNNTLQVEFGALDYVDPESLRYRYRIPGLKDNWTELGSKNSILIGHLEPGDYQLEVSAKNYRNLWNETPSALTIHVLPSLVETNAFKISSFIAVIVGAIAINSLALQRQRRLRIQKQNAEFQAQRDLMNQDLHDAIGNDFARIQATIQTIERDPEALKLTPRFKTVIEQLSDMVKLGTDNLRQVFWTTRTSNDSLEKLIEFTIRLFDSSFRYTDIHCRIEAPTEIDNCPISPFVRHEVICIVKESISNILRHSKATLASLDITIESNNSCIISISDNGIGFPDNEDRSSCSGLNNMRARAARANARLEIQNSDQGVSVKLEFPIKFAD